MRVGLFVFNLGIKEYKPVVWEFPAKSNVSDTSRPNIILIVADDLGYNDLYGNKLELTRNIRRIGENGINISKLSSFNKIICKLLMLIAQ